MILVTGGTGLVGSHLLMELARKEGAIRALYTRKKSYDFTSSLFHYYGKKDLFNKIEWLKVDILNIIELQTAFEEVEYVYHCAAKVSFDPADLEQMMKVNIEGTTNVVNFALENKVKKMCYVSSVAAIGEYLDKKCSDEAAIWTKTKYTTNYSISKYYAENEVWRASEEGLSVVIVNPSTILGAGNWNEGSSAIFKKVYNGLGFYPPGSNSFVGVKDVVKAMRILMESKIVGKRYILSANDLSFKELLTSVAIAFIKKPPRILAPKSLAKAMAKADAVRSLISNKKRVLTAESVGVSYKKTCYSSDKIKQELNFTFQHAEEVIRECAQFYMDNHQN